MKLPHPLRHLLIPLMGLMLIRSSNCADDVHIITIEGLPGRTFEVECTKELEQETSEFDFTGKVKVGDLPVDLVVKYMNKDNSISVTQTIASTEDKNFIFINGALIAGPMVCLIQQKQSVCCGGTALRIYWSCGGHNICGILRMPSAHDVWSVDTHISLIMHLLL
eukprot:GHVS01089051.1.p2 GENE.GHVS01089051.1~~GHVS01089051.1.p2  ORF type:complete len:165 (-),score=12.26 GHVS01089051.1:564-1058(-)